MTTVEMLKEGIIQQNWQLIQDVYFQLTGQTVFTEQPSKASTKKAKNKPAKSTKTSRKVKLQPLEPLGPAEDSKPEPPEPETQPEAQPGNRRNGRREPLRIGQHKNTFVDNLKTFKEDMEFRRKLGETPRVDRVRNKFEPIKVQCTVCRVTYTKSPKMVPEPSRFVCDSCCVRGR